MQYESAVYSKPNKEYRHSGHLFYSCQYHVVFCPKYRRKVLVEPYDTRLKEVLARTAAENEFDILDMEVMPDHVHLLISCDPRLGICKCVQILKGTSSHILRSEFSELKKRIPTLWTRSSFISSVGAVSLDIVKQYIDEQKNR